MTVLASLAVVLVATTNKNSGGSATFLIILVLLGLGGYFVFLRPQQQKRKRQMAMQSEIGVGDEVLTVGGIVGTVLSIDSQRVTILTGVDPAGGNGGGPPTRVVLVRNAIARKIEPVVAADEDEGAEGGHPGYGGVPESDGGADDGAEDRHEVGGTDGGPQEGKNP
jgi:preprotein translocase subunit YajC